MNKRGESLGSPHQARQLSSTGGRIVLQLPKPIRAKRDDRMKPIGGMKVGATLVFPVAMTNRVRVACHRYPEKTYRTRVVEERGERILRVWRAA